MKVTLKTNDKRMYLSDELVKEMGAKRGNMVMIFREIESGEHGLFLIRGAHDEKIIDGTRIRWSRTRGYYLEPKTPPTLFLCALKNVTGKQEFPVHKTEVKQAAVFIWK